MELKEDGEQHATKVVQTRIGVALGDNNDIMELPFSSSEKSLYCSVGYNKIFKVIIAISNKSNHKTVII